MFVLEIIIGVVGGVVAGMGMGGGTLTIPLLTLILNYQQIQAQGVNLIAFLPMSVVALFIHFKNKLVEVKSVWILALVGCGFSLIGSLVAVKIENEILKKIFAVFLICLAIWQLIEMVKNRNKN